MFFILLYILGIMLAIKASDKFIDHVPVRRGIGEKIIFFLVVLSFFGYIFFVVFMKIVPKMTSMEGHLHTYYTVQTKERLSKFNKYEK